MQNEVKPKVIEPMQIDVDKIIKILGQYQVNIVLLESRIEALTKENMALKTKLENQKMNV